MLANLLSLIGCRGFWTISGIIQMGVGAKLALAINCVIIMERQCLCNKSNACHKPLRIKQPARLWLKPPETVRFEAVNLVWGIILNRCRPAQVLSGIILNICRLKNDLNIYPPTINARKVYRSHRYTIW